VPRIELWHRANIVREAITNIRGQHVGRLKRDATGFF
jgi:hypothetical protein